ncbi:efflux RND transporter periplasmic adaptor subunit [Coralloluteibacterium thermophilus]|uniref:Efflux RND transporter periplasmic adaptor subunit n=1 Tax=Coralloluteibacterium thermophilum TaxID=2707049 RepID=A0ABV9NF10_9GAMM
MRRIRNFASRLAARRGLLVAVLVGAVVLWIGSGLLRRDTGTGAPPPGPRVPTVAASWSVAEPVVREIVLYGDVQPTQIAAVRARTDGIVEQVLEVGTRVSSGDILARLSVDDRQARLAQTRAQVESARGYYEGFRQLAERQLVAQSEAQTRLADLEAARAAMQSAELEVANTALRAPIDGVINSVIADLGDYVSVGGEVLEIVDNDPLVAVVNVQQGAVGRVRPGMRARVRFFGAEEREGTVRFVAPLADATTRTFRVEVEVPNADRAMPSGLSAEVAIPTEEVAAHRTSAAVMQLDEQGRIGLHVVDEDARIRFVPVDVVRARADGLWVTGLPERARIVTISQGMLADGQQVEVHDTPEGFLASPEEG